MPEKCERKERRKKDRRAPEPSGEMSDQHRILLGAAISISNALHNEELQGTQLKASTDTAWEKLSLAIEHSSAMLAAFSDEQKG